MVERGSKWEQFHSFIHAVSFFVMDDGISIDLEFVLALALGLALTLALASVACYWPWHWYWLWLVWHKHSCDNNHVLEYVHVYRYKCTIPPHFLR